MLDVLSNVKMFIWFASLLSVASALRCTVEVFVQKWEKINLPFIKQQLLNGLRPSVLVSFNVSIAPKSGIDNLPATV